MVKASIVIPAFNAQKTIADCLNGLQKQSIPLNEFEVLVVDDGSTDRTAEIVLLYPFAQLSRQKNAGPAVARNRGAKKAAADIVVFLDSDCVPRKNWLSEMLKPFKDPRVTGVQGKYENPSPEWMTRFVQFEIEERYERMKKSMQKNGSIDFVGSYSAAYRKKVFLENNGFDEGFRAASGEDPDLSFRLARKGHRLVFAEDAIVAHFHPASLVKYWRTKFYRAYWRVRLYQRNPEKVKNDSYTNPIIKIQMAFAAFAIAFLILGLVQHLFGTYSLFGFLFNFPSFFLSLCTLGILFLASIPTAFFIFKKDWIIGIMAIFIFTVNAFVFVIGYAYGVLKLGAKK
ncbi:MAG: glycosyltransferase [Candidatus Micrarchaeota archaeon]